MSTKQSGPMRRLNVLFVHPEPRGDRYVERSARLLYDEIAWQFWSRSLTELASATVCPPVGDWDIIHVDAAMLESVAGKQLLSTALRLFPDSVVAVEFEADELSDALIHVAPGAVWFGRPADEDEWLQMMAALIARAKSNER